MEELMCTSVLSAVDRVGVQRQCRQGHADVDQQQTGQLVLLVHRHVICRFFIENIQE